MLETLRPDPTFYPSPRIAIEAPAERLAYTVLLSPERSKPDALAVVDVDRSSPSFGKTVYRLDMPTAATNSITSAGMLAVLRFRRSRATLFLSAGT
jgi:56kDa selenium binding protein (SBP56)